MQHDHANLKPGYIFIKNQVPVHSDKNVEAIRDKRQERTVRFSRPPLFLDSLDIVSSDLTRERAWQALVEQDSH